MSDEKEKIHLFDRPQNVERLLKGFYVICILLVLADFVKFAKMIPVANDNEQCMKSAYDFILDTRITSIPAAEENREKEEVTV